MRAIAIQKFDGIEALEVMDLPKPKPASDEILVKIKAAGINPVDRKIREGFLKDRMPYQFPIILGWDASGIIEELGSQISGFKVGDEIFAYTRKEIIHDGSYAEWITLKRHHLAFKPKNLSFEEAAVLPLASLTAYQALFESLKIQKGEKILIHAGGGGVGGYAIPMAKNAGAHVLTTASAGKHAELQMLGADECIDYQKVDFVQEIHRRYPKGLNAVFDTVGGEVQTQSAQVLKAGGRLTSILTLDSDFFHSQNIQANYVFVRPDAHQLEQICNWAETGLLRPRLTQTFALSQAAEAHRWIEQGHGTGKIAFQIP